MHVLTHFLNGENGGDAAPAGGALVLHLVGVTQPVHVALQDAEAETLPERLPGLLSSGAPQSLRTADGGQFTVNFGHVATAHIEQNRSDTHAYGAAARPTGFGAA